MRHARERERESERERERKEREGGREKKLFRESKNGKIRKVQPAESTIRQKERRKINISKDGGNLYFKLSDPAKLVMYSFCKQECAIIL